MAGPFVSSGSRKAGTRARLSIKRSTTVACRYMTTSRGSGGSVPILDKEEQGKERNRYRWCGGPVARPAWKEHRKESKLATGTVRRDGSDDNRVRLRRI